MSQKSGLVAGLSGKCPQCREGDMFQYPLLRVSKFMKMNDSCAHCGLRYEVEPGFFIGAMYISYVVTVALLIAVGTVLYIFNISDTFTYIASVVLINLLLLPFISRYSRIVFLHLFGGVKYNNLNSINK